MRLLTKPERDVLHSLKITPGGVFNSSSHNGWVYGDMKETVQLLDSLVKKHFAVKNGHEYSFKEEKTVKFSKLPEHHRFLKKIDQGTLDSIDNYFQHSLNPGSCTTELIAGNYMEAWFKAHRLIQPHDVWLDYYELGKAIQCYKENYDQ